MKVHLSNGEVIEVKQPADIDKIVRIDRILRVLAAVTVPTIKGN